MLKSLLLTFKQLNEKIDRLIIRKKDFMKNDDLSLYRKTSDILALRHLFDSTATQCNVIIRVVPEFNLDFISIRSHLVNNLITASIAKEDLIKLEQSSHVIAYNVAKTNGTIKLNK